MDMMDQVGMFFFALANIIIASILIALVYVTRRHIPEVFNSRKVNLRTMCFSFVQVHKSFSMVASFLSALTIGLMITCIICVLIIVILSYQKNFINDQADGENSNESLELLLRLKGPQNEGEIMEFIILIQGLLYCIINIALLGKWVREA